MLGYLGLASHVSAQKRPAYSAAMKRLVRTFLAGPDKEDGVSWRAALL